MKLKSLTLAAFVVASSIPLAHAQNLVLNGNFSSGYSNFSSDYIQVTSQQPSGPGGMWLEGRYTVLNNPVNAHASWQSIPAGNPYNSANGQMLIVNGASNLSAVVWTTSAAIDTDPSVDYFFQAIVTNLYQPNVAALNGAVLTFEYSLASAPSNWITLGTVSLASTISGQWQVTPSTALFTIENPSADVNLRIRNGQSATQGNDFAIGLVSLNSQAVPEPGVCALVTLSGVAFMFLRRKRSA